MIVKEKLITIGGEIATLREVTAKVMEMDYIHLVPAKDIVSSTHGLKELKEEISEEYKSNHELLSRIENFHKIKDFVENSSEGVALNLKEVIHKIEDISSKKSELEKIVANEKQLLEKLANLAVLGIDLDLIFNSQFLEIRIGRMLEENFDDLKFYLSRPFIYEKLGSVGDKVIVLYFTTKEFEREVDNIFSMLDFERMILPDYVHGLPSSAYDKVSKIYYEHLGQIDDLARQQEEYLLSIDYSLSQLKASLVKETLYYDSLPYVVLMGPRFSINFFTKALDADRIESDFENFKDIELEIKPARSDHRIIAPTILKNNWFARPFETFVMMYGVPKYGSFDPTLIFAITYSILFGMMFGDFGQGLVLILLGLILPHIKKSFSFFGKLILRLGITSTIFGILYGSAFGFENAFDWLYIGLLHLSSKPIEVFLPSTTMLIIIVTIGIGAFLILVSVIINTIQNFKHHHLAEAIFSHNGLVGIMFYAFVVVAVVLLMGFNINIFNAITIPLMIVIPLILIFLQEPLKRAFNHEKFFEGGIVSFIIEGFFELFEIVLSFLTSTLSFMRVGGFIISHAGMMLVVQTLMHMGGLETSIIAAILGNILVMAIEGLVVGIQCLRLEYFEMFSRYYESSGILFSNRVKNK
ncbi:MAG: hypothetical protein LBV55_04375 [Acholeplasmatales bacterium]|jgi:V/A-type H+-transporting ATPase subunit I|nr:hypothetical protein [Acholeplasmatales bacterium]